MTPPTLPDASRTLRAIADYESEMLTVEEARRLVLSMVEPVQEVEPVDLRSALGRVLANDVLSPIDVPAHDNAAMDGYAFCSGDIATNGVTTLRVAGTAWAGRPLHGTVDRGSCVRIMTGAVMPEGCDTVVPQELITSTNPESIDMPQGVVRAGDHRRHRGEDLQCGQPALRSGRILHPADLGLLASLGIGHVMVKRRLRVAFFSTGDELRSLGQILDDGCIFDSNRYTLIGMLTRLGCELVDMGVVEDNATALDAAFRSACAAADVVITSGGVSVGEADHTRKVIAGLGEVAFWKIAMRPGRPMAFGRITDEGKSACLFGLPGNPVAVMVTFYFLARDALLHMMGASPAPLLQLQAVSEATIRKKPGRTEYQRAVVATGADGRASVRITGSQGSGVLRSMSEANCMVVLHHNRGNVAPGESVDVVVFDGLT